MRISHRIRMFMLKRKADYLIRYARRRQHVQSDHMIGYPAPREPEYGMSLLCAFVAFLIICLAISVNVYKHEIDMQNQPVCRAEK